MTAWLDRELTWLDVALDRLVERQRNEGRYQGDDHYRGRFVAPTLAHAALAARRSSAGDDETVVEARRVLDKEIADLVEAGVDLDAVHPLAGIAASFELTPFERLVVLAAAAVDLDSRYAPVFGFLTDDPARRRPTAGLLMELYAGCGPGAAALRSSFAAGGRLTRWGLIELVGDPAGLLADREVRTGEWMVTRLAGLGGIDDVDGALRVAEGRAEPLAPGIHVALTSDELAAVAGLVGGPCYVLDLALHDCDGIDSIRRAARQSRADRIPLVLAGGAQPAAARHRPMDRVVERLVEHLADDLPIVVVTEAPTPPRWVRHRLAPIGATERAARWRVRLAEAGLDASDIDPLADSHALSLTQIDDAVAFAATSGVSAAEGARLASTRMLTSLARRVESSARWDDLILPEAVQAQLADVAAAITNRRRVLDRWGFGRRAGGRGLHVLFSGQSGTGKTLAASVIAGSCGLDLYVVDLAQVVDKYLGETEKQLDRVLGEAVQANAMLFFDEADALFGRRADVKEARDRYANLEVAYLLQRIESHDGVTVLATNLGQHLDSAFARRLHHRVEFPLPDATQRRRLWRRCIPPEAPLADPGDLDRIADRFDLTGGSIRNAALSAAFLAAGEEAMIELRHLALATVRELTKSGRAPTRAELGELQALLPPVR